MSTTEPAGGPTFLKPAAIPRGWAAALAFLVLVGVVGMIVGLATDPVRAWQAYLATFLFFAGFGAGGVLFARAIEMSSGRWGRPVKRIAEALGAFLPATFILFLILIPGLPRILPWVKTPYGPRGYLNLPFLVLRDAGALLFMLVLGLYLLAQSLRVDLGYANERGGAFTGPVHRFLTRNWRGTDAEVPRARRRLAVASPLFAAAYAWLYSMLAVDLIMSLNRDWYSTLIGGYYFVGCFYVTLAVVLVAVFWTRRRFGLEDQIRPNHLVDVANLAMSFGIMTAYFFFAQLLIIWYGNIPRETSFLVHRTWTTPWGPVAVAVIVLSYLVPLLAILNRSWKTKAWTMTLFAALVSTGVWLSRNLEVAPAITGGRRVTIGPLEVSVFLGFLGLLGLSFLVFIHRVPPIVLRDPVLDAPPEDER